MAGKTSITSERVQELRNRKRLTQEKFAETIGCGVDTIRKIETADRKLSPDIAMLMARKFNVSLDWLYGVSADINDTAGAIIMQLLRFFQVGITIREYMNSDGVLQEQEYLTLTIDKPLYQCLHDLHEAEKFKEEKGLPPKAYDLWVADILQKYTEYLKEQERTEEPSETITHICVPEELLHDDSIDKAGYAELWRKKYGNLI